MTWREYARSGLETLTAKQSATIHYRVRNSGHGNILDKTWTDELYLSADPLLDASDILLGAVNVTAGPAAGASYDNTMNITRPGGTLFQDDGG